MLRSPLAGRLLWAAAGTLAFLVGCASGQGQPHMQAALDHLNSAKSELQVATHNKGGHRVNAIRLINEAIDQVNRGIAAGGS